MEELKITSKAFEHGGWIPQRYSGYGENISPPIMIKGIVKSAVSMVITLDDLDHPLFSNFNHWIAWNLKPTNIIPEGLPKGAVIEYPIYLEQGVAYGKHCYRGPKPPFNWKHDYLFTIYILDIQLTASTKSNKKAILNEIKGHILQKGVLKGTFQKSPS